jgi:hypothetical protein
LSSRQLHTTREHDITGQMMPDMQILDKTEKHRFTLYMERKKKEHPKPVERSPPKLRNP